METGVAAADIDDDEDLRRDELGSLGAGTLGNAESDWCEARWDAQVMSRSSNSSSPSPKTVDGVGLLGNASARVSDEAVVS